DRPIIARALSKKPDDRWPTCTDLVRSLRLSGLQPAPLPSASGPPLAPVPTPGVDSNAATRFQAERSGRLGPDPVKANTPPPPVSPPLRGLAGSRPGGGSGATSTPLPQLVTAGPGGSVVPRLVTPSAGSSVNPAITL